jgi:molybdopterin adenylyltransferase
MADLRTAILTVSDKASRGEREDRSGPAIAAWLHNHSAAVVSSALLPDDEDAITAQLEQWADSSNYDLILTAGGTGVAPRDRTPEATIRTLERAIPGIAEAMRAGSIRHTPYGMLSRAVAGIRKQTLILNLPGNPKAALECIEIVWPALRHAITKIQGDMSDCVPPD